MNVGAKRFPLLAAAAVVVAFPAVGGLSSASASESNPAFEQLRADPVSWAIQTGELPSPTLPVLQACLDIKSQGKQLPEPCEKQIAHRDEIEDGATSTYSALGIASIPIAIKTVNGDYG